MPEEPVPGPFDTEMREASLPDGKVVTIAVKRGLPQDEVDLLAARIWQDIPGE
ncbi:hypothetical protein [Streptomyces sp. cg35]|uniref:hypothetical protein n=1 Tax=Streptomyces sp. cg35 TaxID=3421650 RepID=UPI003D17F882